MMEYSDISTALCKKLIALCNDQEYVCGILNELETDDNMQKLLDFIDRGNTVTPESVCLYALEIIN